MAKKIKLSIAEPCHENWDAMTTVEKGKFCGSCQKQVIDFSNMSDRQVAEFFKKPTTGSVCGRFMADQLDRSIDIPKKRIPWVKYFFQFALPAFLLSLKSNSAKAQGNISVKVSEKNRKKSSAQNEQLRVGTTAIIVPDKLMGDTITMEEVVVVGKSVPTHFPKSPVQTLLEGKVAVPKDSLVKEEIRITNIDFDFNQNIISNCSSPINDTNIIMIAGGISVDWNPEKEKQKIQVIKEPIVEKATPSFKVYPNPISTGSNLTIECKQTEEGYYRLELLNTNGQSVHQQEIWIDAEARILNIDIPMVAAGNYFLVLVNKKSGKKFTEKLVIQ